MSKLLVVFGATGQQGASVVHFVLKDPELSKQFRIRAITRDPSKPAAQELSKHGVDVVAGDASDKASLEKALQGVHSVFAMTNSVYDTATAYDVEYAQGKAIADATVSAGGQYLIFSTTPHAGRISDGKLSQCILFDVKADIETYIRKLPIKSAFFGPASFMQNYAGNSKPRPMGDGTYAIMHLYNPTTEVPLIDIEADTGKWVGAILAEPDKYNGKFFAAATKTYTHEALANAISKATGKTVTYKQVPDDVFKNFLPPSYAQPMLEMFVLIRDYGYFGKDQKQLVEWAANNARGKLTTLEEFLQRDPIKLE